jgi:zinc protease
MIATILLATLLQAPRDTGVAQYDVDGVRVIHHQRDSASNTVAVQLFLLGGSRQLTDTTAGIEPFLLMASAYGTTKYPGENARRASARAGAAIEVDPSSDWTVYGFQALKQDFDSAWAVYADRLLHPTLDSASVEIVRKRMVGWMARRHASPEAYAWYLADSASLASHAYALAPEGSARSLPRIDRALLRQYLATQMVTSRMLLVVVGDVSRDHVERAVHASLGALPRGSYVWSLPTPIRSAKPDVVASNWNTSTNYLVGVMAGPARSSADYPAFERAMGFLSGLISFTIREKFGLSYHAGVSVSDRGASSAAIYVSTTNPDSTIKLINGLWSVIESPAMIPRKILREGAQSMRLSFIRLQETAYGEASLLGAATLYDGDPLAPRKRAAELEKIAYTDLRGALMTYARNIRYAYVGDTTRLPRPGLLKR